MKQTQALPDSQGQSDTEVTVSQNSHHGAVAPPALLKQIEHMLNKALKQTLDHITDSLTREIRELGNRTAELEIRVDQLENTSLHGRTPKS